MSARSIILIPTYNERESLPDLVEEVLATVDADIMVIDDNSPDGTGEVADRMAAREPRLQVLHRPGKQGLGRAYLAGFRRALEQEYAFILQMDADGSHQPSHLPALLEAARTHDLVLGSRYVRGGGTRNWGLGRQLLSRGGSLYARTILGVPIRDLTGGFKCWRREVLENVDLDRVAAEGYAFQIEMTYQTLRRGYRVAEIPITFVERREGASKMSRRIVAEAVWMVWKLRLGG